MKEILLYGKYSNKPHLFYRDHVLNTNTLLLESAEIVDKSGTKSIIGASSALKVICNDLKVTLKAINDNGCALIPLLAAKLKAKSCDEKTITLSYARPPKNIDEETRLKFPSPLDALRAVQDTLKEFKDITFAGIIAFDFINNFEEITDVSQGLNTCPDLVFNLYDISVVFDHINKTTVVHGYAFNEKNKNDCLIKAYKLKEALDSFNADLHLKHPKVDKLSYSVNIDDKAFEDLVVKIKDHIIKGDAFQVVPSRVFSLPCHDPFLSYAYLKEDNPSPYMYYIQDVDFTLIGASPEFALRYDKKSNEVSISPIAGTRARGIDASDKVDPDLDARIELELRMDQKEVSEHIMLVDLARNDLARIAKTGTRRVENLLHVDRYQSVMHLVSDVKAELKEDLDALHAYQASMNMGTLSGAPKIMAHKIIYKYEGVKRGSYGGVVARLETDGSFDSCIAIRSAFIKNDIAYIQSGCGVVFDSDPEAEAMETVNKARSVIRAVSKANKEF